METSANKMADIGQELQIGLTVRELLDLPAMEGCEILAGHDGLDRVIDRVNVMEVPDVLPWVKPGELLLTTGFPLRRMNLPLTEWLAELEASGVSVVAVKFGRYLDELPDEVLAVADELRLPLLSFPDGVGFDDVMNPALERILDHKATVLARAEHLLHDLVAAVVGGGGLEAVGTKLAEEMAEAIIITSPDGRVLVQVPRPGVTMPGELDCFDPSGRYRAEREELGKVYTEQGWARLAVPIKGAGRDLGRVVAFTRSSQYGQLGHMLNQAAAAAAIVMTRDRAVATVESKYRADFLRDALRGRAGDAEQVSNHASAFGWDLTRPLAVVVAERRGVDAAGVHERVLRDNFAAAWNKAALAADGRAAVAAYSDEMVILLGVNEDAGHEEINREVARLARDVRGVGGGGRQPFTTGISRTLLDITDLPKAYAEARKAVEVGARMYGTQSVVHFNQLGVFRLLSLIESEAEVEEFITETLGELASNAEGNDDLLATLECLLDNSLNVAETARELHFHYNSLRYRIGKLERLLGPFVTDPQIRFAIQVALAARQLRRNTEKHRQDVT